MKTITKEVLNTIVIKNSKFITLLLPINNQDNILSILNNIKNEYKNATHYCYAYVIDDIKHCSDDGEPSGTAGLPILNVLQRNNLNNVLCVVIRYFGGIKLGAGGLIRAYGKSVTEALKTAIILDINEGYVVTINFSYDNLKTIETILNNMDIMNKSFDEIITYSVRLKTDYEDIIKRLELAGANIIEIKKDYYVL